MYFCYIDESGNTGSNLQDANQPYLVLGVLMIKPESIQAVENDIRLLGYKYFSAEARNTDFEFHGDGIYNARKKDKYFHKLNLEKRFQIFDEIINIILEHKSINLGYICVDKKYYYGKLHIQQTAFQLLTEKVEEQLKGKLNSYCLLIADEQDELEQKLIDDLDSFKQNGTTFGYKSIPIEKIIDSVHFVQSHNNYLMQLTDVICYIIRKGKESQHDLMYQYQDYRSENKGTKEFSVWVEEDAHKGKAYFYRSYKKLYNEKNWIFTKDFP